MATPNQIATYIASKLDREFDEPFKRMLMIPVDAWRATLVSRSLEKHPQQRRFFRQTIWMPMGESKAIPCKVPIPLCNIARSKYPLPALPLRFGNELFDFVGTIDGMRGFIQADPGTLRGLMSGKYSQHKIFYEYTNEYFEIRQNKHIPMIRIDGVFDKPTLVMEFNCKNGNGDCDWWNKEYPCPLDMVQMIIQSILQVDFQVPNVPEAREIEVNALVPKNKYEA